MPTFRAGPLTDLWSNGYPAPGVHLALLATYWASILAVIQILWALQLDVLTLLQELYLLGALYFPLARILTIRIAEYLSRKKF